MVEGPEGAAQNVAHRTERSGVKMTSSVWTLGVAGGHLRLRYMLSSVWEFLDPNTWLAILGLGPSSLFHSISFVVVVNTTLFGSEKSC